MTKTPNHDTPSDISEKAAETARRIANAIERQTAWRENAREFLRQLQTISHSSAERQCRDLFSEPQDMRKEGGTRESIVEIGLRAIQILFGTERFELRPASGSGTAERLPPDFPLPESWLGRPIILKAEKLKFADTGRPTCRRIYPNEAGTTLRLRLIFEARETVVETSMGNELLVNDEDVATLVAIEIIECRP